MIGDKVTYIYLDNNVPKHKINYSYAKYYGEEFVELYINSRQSLLSEIINNLPLENIHIISNSDTEVLFTNWINKLKSKKHIDTDRLNLLLKRFEVTKKIYSSYDSNFRPISKDSYKEYRLYVLFATVLVLKYQQTKQLQYLNSLLKINDINLSMMSRLQNNDLNLLNYCTTKELEFIQEIKNRLQ